MALRKCVSRSSVVSHKKTKIKIYTKQHLETLQLAQWIQCSTSKNANVFYSAKYILLYKIYFTLQNIFYSTNKHSYNP